MESKTLKILFSLILAFGHFSLWAQLSLVTDSHDFGMLLRADQNWADFEIANADSKDAVIFRVEGPKNTDIKLSAKTVKAGSSEKIRVAVSPAAAGKFNIELLVYASPWRNPRAIRLRGESSFAANGLIPCPNFEGDGGSGDKEFHISVRDMSRNLPVEGASIRIYRDGRKMAEIEANQYGEASVELPLGRYYFAIDHEGQSLDTAMYVNAVSNHLLAAIDRRALRDEAPEAEPLPDKGLAYIPTQPAQPSQPAQPKAPLAEARDETPPAPLAVPLAADLDLREDENAVLPLSRFKQNNLVFLVDVSSSMKKNGKMELLKIAMVELLDALRDVDRFSLISYASDTRIIIETEGNLDRAACIAAILALEAGGSTEGAKAIDKAGQVAERHFAEGGNNQIILATDGAFNEGVDKALRYADRYRKKDVTLSVLGIRSGPFTTKQMTELATEGGGDFIAINEDRDASAKLLAEIKRRSVR